MMSWRRNVSLQQNGIVCCLLLSPLLFIILQSSNPASEMTLCHLNCQLHKASPEEWVAETNIKTPKNNNNKKNCVVVFVHNPYSTNHVFKQFSVCLPITSIPEEMGGRSQADLLTTTQDKGFPYPHNMCFTIMKKLECSTWEILLEESAETSLCCLIFWTGWGFCSHFLWSSGITLMCCCSGRGDGQPPCSPTQLEVEEGWRPLCVFGCFQHCVGCFTGKYWQKIPGDLCRRHRERG